jgi:hypothetical protein
MGQSIESLPLPQRLEAYRHFAEEALCRANEAKGEEARAAFFAMAARWHLLAIEVERAMKAAAEDDTNGWYEDPMTEAEYKR